MASVWPWLSVAALGALHGANPASGWMVAAAWGLRCGSAAQARQALWPIAAGHAASIAIVAAAAHGLASSATALQRLWTAALALGGALLLLPGRLRLSASAASPSPSARPGR
jgi:hypothetical protein